jgi:hypothetical protein
MMEAARRTSSLKELRQFFSFTVGGVEFGIELAKDSIRARTALPRLPFRAIFSEAAARRRSLIAIL